MNFRILIVDDTKEIQLVVSSALKSLDVSFEFAFSGLEALDKISQFHPNLVILDIMMPVMDGYETLKKIKQIKEFKETPIIFLSAKTGLENRILGYKAGAIHYLEKPFEVRELRALVSSFIKVNDSAKPGLENHNFTKTEKCIFDFLFSHLDQSVSRSWIEDHLPGRGTNKSRSLDTHISSLRKKLKASPYDLSTIYGEGYLLQLKSNFKKAA